MGSPARPNSWSPYNNYKDCSTGICSIYCPQWCYIVFPPPPPFSSGGDDSGTNFSPLIIAIIGVLASAFLLIAYYTLISKYCKRRRANAGEVDHEPEPTDLSHTHNQDQWQGPAATSASAGLDQSLIESIAVHCYKKEDRGPVEGATECAVCLSEFQENEKLRLLPKCSHAFHVPCIDAWLKSHSNCPLCRANVASQPDPLAVHSSSSFNVSSLRVQPSRDLVLVVEDPDTGYRTEAVVLEHRENVQEDFEKLGSPVRLQASQHRRNLLVSDVLRISEEEEEEEIYRVIHRLPAEIGPSRGIREEENGMGTAERSMSPGRLSCTSRNDDKGKDSVVPD
ncbi:hypothetical protein RHGRI_019411 [Rhododendron griersonianum]|uniref:RING-type E3 ubiquitin transferase n=1 Tax=Rhododendron griersonianum TaxID=479676 RepID=A0AAV6JHW8_9ERIC|nr:hypothetical protein RHGRI_019411 [Rhododendron griersonianum]